MNSGHTAPRDGPRSRSSRGSRHRSGAQARLAARHRRRRLAALAVLAVLALVIGLGLGTGGGASSAHRVSAHPSGYFNRLRTLAGSGVGSFAIDEQGDENAAITRTLAYTPYVRVAGSQHKEIALTFDDGPGPYTPRVLSVLERLHVPVTFFEVGVEETYFHASTAAIVARGYPIGDHTETHAPMSKLAVKDQQSQLLQDAAAIGEYGAPFPHMFRPPYGLWSLPTLGLLKKYRMLMILWSVETGDYLMPGTGVIVQRALAGARPGAIILMHDAGGDRSQTVAALPQIIRKLRARGYRLVTVPRLILDNPPPRHQAVASLAGGGG